MRTSAIKLPRTCKRLIVFSVDLINVAASLALALSLLHHGQGFDALGAKTLPFFGSVVMFAAVLFFLLRLPHTKLSAFEDRAMFRLVEAAVILSLYCLVISYFMGVAAPVAVSVIFGAMFFIASMSARLIALRVLARLNKKWCAGRMSVAIYGAGSAGIQLAAALNQSLEARPVLFFDDNPARQGLLVAGIPVHRPSRMKALLAQHKVSRVLLAMPSAPRARQQALVEQLTGEGYDVQILPSFVDLLSNRGLAAPMKPVSPTQLLGRSKVELDTPEIAKTYAGKVVMVTGAGGSIGSELCRQLLQCNPARIVLFERGEYALYAIDREIRHLADQANISVVTRLGSVTNPARVADVIKAEAVEIILHAAAYKHVPLVEDNEIEGAVNNVLGTRVVAAAAEAAGIERFILISTDKAVRPTNIMGATKRMAEMVVQDLQTRATVTKCAMVRFGNVLGSSGSVLPLFQKQIETGGPVTVTHPDVTRFFMTIPEAARLVLLAGAYAEGGDVFVLDMGEPQRIIDIARKMIELTGHAVKDPATGEGDIEIRICGLRPGEKLYEELLIDGDTLVKTPHRKIMRAREFVPRPHDVAQMLTRMQDVVARNSRDGLRQIVEDYVEGYHQSPADTPVAVREAPCRISSATTAQPVLICPEVIAPTDSAAALHGLSS